LKNLIAKKVKEVKMRGTRRLIFLLLVCSSLFSLPADDVIPIPNREYMPALHEVLKNAKKKIHVLMFTARYYPEYPNDANSIILRDLIEARKRGVEVVVVLDASNWNKDNTIKNRMFADSLKKAGVEVYYDPVDVTTHDKLIIVDDYITIVGSTNWSYYALERNNEASVLIKSEQVAKEFEKHFRNVLRFSTKEIPAGVLE